MTVFLTPLLDFLQACGYPALGLAILVAAFGAPLPISLVLLAAGAFSAQGYFNVALLALLAAAASVAGDCAGYVVGRVWGSRILLWLPRTRLGRPFITPEATLRSRRFFRRHGGWAIFLTRFLVTALGSVTNLVAGTELFPFRSFLCYDIAGEALGAALFLGLGFAFGAAWQAVGDIWGDVSLFALGLALVILLTYSWLRYLTRDREPQPEEASHFSEAQQSGR